MRKQYNSMTRDQADADKIEIAVSTLIQNTLDAGKDRAAFCMRPLFDSLKLSRMTRKDFPEAVCDVPSGSTFCRKFGSWVIGEYGDDIFVAIRLGEDRSGQWITSDLFHTAFLEQAKPQRRKTQMVQVEIPASDDPVAAVALMKELYDNNQQ